MIVEFESRVCATEIMEGVWSLDSLFVANVIEKKRTLRVFIQKGFVTDFCSVPRIPFAYMMLGGIGNRAGLLHDGLYSKRQNVTVLDKDGNLFIHTRAWADDVFAAGLKACGISAIKINAMWAGVRALGEKHYKK